MILTSIQGFILTVDRNVIIWWLTNSHKMLKSNVHWTKFYLIWKQNQNSLSGSIKNNCRLSNSYYEFYWHKRKPVSHKLSMASLYDRSKLTGYELQCRAIPPPCTPFILYTTRLPPRLSNHSPQIKWCPSQISLIKATICWIWYVLAPYYSEESKSH